MYELTVRVTQALVSFAPLAFKLFYAARHNAVLRWFGPRRDETRQGILLGLPWPAEGPHPGAVLAAESRRRLRVQVPVGSKYHRSGGNAPRAGRLGKRTN